MRLGDLLALIAWPASVAASAADPATISVIGWWDNPTPNNAWVRDGRTEFTVSEQGGKSAEGDWPEFARPRFVRTNRSYGYGCVRLHALVAGGQVERITSAVSLPLKRCRASAALRKAEPSTK